LEAFWLLYSRRKRLTASLSRSSFFFIKAILVSSALAESVESAILPDGVFSIDVKKAWECGLIKGYYVEPYYTKSLLEGFVRALVKGANTSFETTWSHGECNLMLSVERGA